MADKLTFMQQAIDILSVYNANDDKFSTVRDKSMTISKLILDPKELQRLRLKSEFKFQGNAVIDKLKSTHLKTNKQTDDSATDDKPKIAKFKELKTGETPTKRGSLDSQMSNTKLGIQSPPKRNSFDFTTTIEQTEESMTESLGYTPILKKKMMPVDDNNASNKEPLPRYLVTEFKGGEKAINNKNSDNIITENTETQDIQPISIKQSSRNETDDQFGQFEEYHTGNSLTE